MTIQITLTQIQHDTIQERLHRSQCRKEILRCLMLRNLAAGKSPALIAEFLGCAVSGVYALLTDFRREGLGCLRDKRQHRVPTKARWPIRQALLQWLQDHPEDHGWSRGTWTLELLSLQLARCQGVTLHPSHIHRLLQQEHHRLKRPRPMGKKEMPGKAQRLAEIEVVVQQASVQDEVFWLDMADIDLNPRLGRMWYPVGQQPLVWTPGTNQKRPVAGALNARTGTLTHVYGEKKDAPLFIDLLETLAHRYRRAKTLHLVLDNYKVHTCKLAQQYLEVQGKRFVLHFLPVYSPEANVIERLWKQLHDHVTRNHRCKTMAELLERVEFFLQHAQPFPGSGVSTLRLAA